jgi:hypothetical protein
MPRTYFKPENFQALAWVFEEARLMLQKRNEADPATLDHVADRIFALASSGMARADIWPTWRTPKFLQINLALYYQTRLRTKAMKPQALLPR